MRFLWPKILLVLLVLYSGALLYGTLTPFRFTWHPGRDTISSRGKVEWIPFSRLCPVHGIFCPRDTVLNFAMFIPFGALVVARYGARGSVLGRTARAGTWGFCLSGLIETTQYFIPSRFPSTTDLLLNTLGACVGGFVIAGLLKQFEHRTLSGNLEHRTPTCPP